MAVRKSPEAREFLSLHRVQGCADPFHTRCARSARAGTRFSKLKVAPFLHCSVTPRRPHEAFPGPGSSVAVGRSQPPPALPAAARLQRPYAAHRTLYARRPSHPLLAPSANAVRVDHECTASQQRERRFQAASAAQRAAVRRTQRRCASAGHWRPLIRAAATGSIAKAATRRHDDTRSLWWG